MRTTLSVLEIVRRPRFRALFCGGGGDSSGGGGGSDRGESDITFTGASTVVLVL